MGYVFLLAGAATIYEARKQWTVTLSNIEAEFMAEGVKDAIYLRSFLQELGVESS